LAAAVGGVSSRFSSPLVVALQVVVLDELADG
jgi:hypothetical protein